MHKRITFRGMQHSPAIESYADEQLGKIVKFLERESSPIYIDLVLEPSKVHAHHRVELRLKSPNFDLISNYEGKDIYDVMDRTIDTMYRELRNAKKRLTDKRNGDSYKSA